MVTLDDLAREGARRMIAAALNAEVEQCVAAFIDEVDEDGKRLVVRNGRARERKLTVGSGTVPIRAPRVNDKRVDESGGTVRVPRIGSAKAKVYTLTKASRGIAKGATAVLMPKLSYRARAAIRRALRRHRRITVKLRITVADAAGNARTLTRQVKLRL